MTSTLEIEKIVCPQCYAVLDVTDKFCRHCGVPMGEAEVPWAAVVPAVPQRPRWSENRWVVLLMLFLVLGPLGLPMLWRSRQFPLFWKLLLTTFLLAVMLAILGMCWYVMQKSLQPLTELRKYQGL